LGGGHYVYGASIYLGSIYIYEKPPDCTPVEMHRPGKGYRRNLRKNPTGPKGKKEGKMGLKKKMTKKKKKNAKKKKIAKKKKKKRCVPSRHGAILVDAPPSAGPDFGKLVHDFLDEHNADLEIMIVSHEHFDHVGNGLSVMEYNPMLTEVITTADVAETLHSWTTQTFSNPRLSEIMAPGPQFPFYEFTYVFEGTEILEIGNQTLELRGTDGHTSGNLLIWHEGSKTITSIDSPVFPKWSPFTGFALASDVSRLFNLFESFREYDYDYFIGGHVTHIGTPEDVAVSEEYAVDIADAAYRAVFELSADPTGPYGFFHWFLKVGENPQNNGNIFLVISQWIQQLELLCAEIVLDPQKNYSGKDWVKILAGVRTTLISHCSVTVNALRIDTPGLFA